MERIVSSWNWRGWPHVLTLLLLAVLAAPHSEAAVQCKLLTAESRNAEIEWYPRDELLAAASEESFYVITWYCDRTYRWGSNYVVGYVKDLPADFLSKGRQLLAMSVSDFLAAMDTISVPDACKAGVAENRYTPLCPTMLTQLRLTVPPPIIWEVRAASGASRPVYRAVKGTNGVWTRNTAAVASVRVSDSGSRCIPTDLVIEEGTSVYASVIGLPNVATVQPDDVIGSELVALCVRTN